MKHKWIYVSKNTHRLETNIIKKIFNFQINAGSAFKLA